MKKEQNISLSTVELREIQNANSAVQMAQNNVTQVTATFKMLLRLVGDRYNVNLENGEYDINNDGVLNKRVPEPQPEKS